MGSILSRSSPSTIYIRECLQDISDEEWRSAIILSKVSRQKYWPYGRYRAFDDGAWVRYDDGGKLDFIIDAQDERLHFDHGKLTAYTKGARKYQRRRK